MPPLASGLALPLMAAAIVVATHARAEDVRPRPTAQLAAISGTPSDDARQRAQALGLGPRRAAVAILIGPPPAEWIATAAQAAAVSGSVSAPAQLLWPVTDGKLLRGVGPAKVSRAGKAKGKSRRRHRHAGLDIGANEGTEIHAAQSGLVVYAGRGVRGYGKLVVIVHADGSATMYAHCKEMLVEPGQLVARADTIAQVGQTGRARGPHLHFEYRVNGEALDPLDLFAPRAQLPASDALTPTEPSPGEPAR